MKSKMAKQKNMGDGVKVHGFFRLKIKEGDKVVGDSGWRKNQVVNLGFQDYIVGSIGGLSGSKQVSHLAIGTGTVPGATATSLDGEITDAAGMRMSIVTQAAVASKTLRMTGSLNSNVITAAKTIQNIGIFNTSTTNVGTLLAGNTYTTSALATNQTVNATYELRFS